MRPFSGSTISPVESRRAIAFTVKSRRRMSSSTERVCVRDDLEVVTAGPGAHLLAGRRELDPRRREPPDVLVARVQPRADEAAGDDEVFDLAVRRECLLQSVRIDARNEEVRVLGLEAQQLVAHGAADEIGVEAELVDVVL